MLFGEDDETCELCGRRINEVPSDQLRAHWGGPNEAVIVAWTCSPACAVAYNGRSEG